MPVASSTPSVSVDALPGLLGYEEYHRLRLVRQRATDAVLSAESLQEEVRAYTTYQKLGMRHVEALPGDTTAGTRAQIGLIIAAALIWRDSGRLEQYFNALLHAYEYAENASGSLDMSDILPVLERELAALSAD